LGSLNHLFFIFISDISTPAANRARGHNEMVLDLSVCEQSLSGFACVYVKKFEDTDGSMIYDYLELIRFSVDIRDIMPDGNKPAAMSAKLLEDGTGMVVTEPMLPLFFLRNQEEINESDPYPVAKQADIKQKVDYYNSRSERPLRQTIIYFPEGMIGTTEYIGSDTSSTERSKDLELFSSIFNIPPTEGIPDELDFFGYFAYWKIGIKGSAQKIGWSKQEEELFKMNVKFKKLKLKGCKIDDIMDS
jgi:hypothetical protein